MKALVGAFNQEKIQVGAFSVIVKTDCETERSCSLSARYKITPRICEMSSEENSILTVPTTDSIAPRSREICKCNLFSIFNIFSIFVFFLNVPEFCPFNSSTDMKSYLSLSQFSLTSKISRISIDHYREMWMHKFQHSPSLSALHPLLELFPACGFNWRSSLVSGSPPREVISVESDSSAAIFLPTS